MRKLLGALVVVLVSTGAVAAQSWQGQISGTVGPTQSFQAGLQVMRLDEPVPAAAPQAARTDLPNPFPSEQAIVAPAVFDGPAPVAVAPPPQLGASAAAVGAGVWAVVIGVDDYPGSSNDLSAAVADADETYNTLRSFGVPDEQILVLTDGQVTDRTIDRAGQWLVERAGPNSVAVFAFAGHIRALDADTEAFLGSDGSTYRDDELASTLAGLRAKQTWFMLAGCYAGGFTEPLGPGRLLTAAADSQSLAYENPNMGRSYIVEYLVRRGLRNQEAGPNPTVQDAYNWAYAQLRKDHPGRQPYMYMTEPVAPIHLQAVIGAPSGGGPSGDPTAPQREAAPPPQQSPPTTQPPSRRCRVGVAFCSSS